YARVAALFTFSQLAGEWGPRDMSKWVHDPALREFALRAIVDDENRLDGVDPRQFVDALADPNPRVRVQAAIGLGRLRDPSFCDKLVPLTADKDWNVRHAAQQSLRELGGSDACITAIQRTDDPRLISGAMMAIRGMHDRHTVVALEHLIKQDDRKIVRHQAITALERLYEVEATWDGSWWNTRPDTRGPNYKSARWEESGEVASMLIALAGSSDPDIRKDAIAAIGLCGVGEAVPLLTQMVSKDIPERNDAAAALVQMKSPEAVAAMEKIAGSSSFQPDLRAKAASAIAANDSAEAQAAVIRMVSAMDGESA